MKKKNYKNIILFALILFVSSQSYANNPPIIQPGAPGENSKILNPKEAHKFIGKKYDATNVYCGSLDDRESSYIFDKKTKILDCVLVPIKNIDCPGVLALGSKAAETYSDKKDTLFLEFIAEALSSLIERNNY